MASFGPGGFRTTDYLLGAHQTRQRRRFALLYRGSQCHQYRGVPNRCSVFGAVPMFWDVAVGTPLTSGVIGGVVVASFGLLVTTFDPALGDRCGKGCPRIRFGSVFRNRAGSHGPNHRRRWSLARSSATVNSVHHLIGFCTIRGVPRIVRGHALRFSAAAGILGSIGVLCYTAGFQRGSVTAVAVAASLFPIPTAILAATFDNDSLRWWQIIGIGIVVAGIGLIAKG